MPEDYAAEVIERLDRIEAAIQALAERGAVREWYTTDEAAKLLGRAEYTVREWCRQGRLNAQKRSGRGSYPSWAISHAEIERYHREGLLPLPQRDGQH